MPLLPSSTVTVRIIGRGRVHSHRRVFSTTRELRGGSFFNLGGLGASREAQYLSREHGIPRTEYSANTHLIRSSEVDPFAPAPGATPSVAATPAARAGSQSSNVRVAPVMAHDSLVVQLQAAREELEKTKRALSSLASKNKRLETAVILIPVLASMIAFVGYQVYSERGEELPESWQSLSKPLGVHAQQFIPEIHNFTPPRSHETAEEHALPQPTSTSFQTHSTTSAGPGRSFLTGLFWARN